MNPLNVIGSEVARRPHQRPIRASEPVDINVMAITPRTMPQTIIADCLFSAEPSDIAFNSRLPQIIAIKEKTSLRLKKPIKAQTRIQIPRLGRVTRWRKVSLDLSGADGAMEGLS